MTPKEYLALRNISIKDCAAAIGCSREHLTCAINGGGCGKKLAKAFEEWSGGAVDRILLLYPEEYPNPP